MKRNLLNGGNLIAIEKLNLDQFTDDLLPDVGPTGPGPQWRKKKKKTDTSGGTCAEATGPRYVQAQGDYFIEVSSDDGARVYSQYVDLPFDPRLCN